jgi:hypothetical protein
MLGSKFYSKTCSAFHEKLMKSASLAICTGLQPAIAKRLRIRYIDRATIS